MFVVPRLMTLCVLRCVFRNLLIVFFPPLFQMKWKITLCFVVAWKAIDNCPSCTRLLFKSKMKETLNMQPRKTVGKIWQSPETTCSCFHFILNIIITDFSFIKYLIINTSIFFSLFFFRVSIWVKMLQLGISKQLRF